jgi:hypothetical protein
MGRAGAVVAAPRDARVDPWNGLQRQEADMHAGEADRWGLRDVQRTGVGRRVKAMAIAGALVPAMVGRGAEAFAAGPIAGPQQPYVTAGSPASPEQLTRWRSVTLDGATCGGPPGADGARTPYKYYLNPGTAEGSGILFMLSGGGVCLKDGHAPSVATGAARQLYCMDFSNFSDPYFADATFAVEAITSRALPYFNRDDEANPFATWTYAALPYCTGDVHAGSMTAPYDYDPDPDGRFDILHRGHLNVMAVLDDVNRRYPTDVPVVLTGVSAGGFGAIVNFPFFVARYPRTTLIPDAGIGPGTPGSLLVKHGAVVAERWLADAVLPDYCNTPDCVVDTLHLLAAHAEQYDGRDGRPWRPFGLLQSQQDATLSAYLEISACSYELGLRNGLLSISTENVRAYAPASTRHVFALLNPLTGEKPFVSQRGVDAHAWFRDMATATTADEMPASAIDPWLQCNPTLLPLSVPGGRR